jgi:hypothetical protein
MVIRDIPLFFLRRDVVTVCFNFQMGVLQIVTIVFDCPLCMFDELSCIIAEIGTGSVAVWSHYNLIAKWN